MSEGGSLVSDSSNFNKDSIQNVIVIALVVCLFCAIVVAGSAVALKERRVENKALDKSKNVLIAAGLFEEGVTKVEDINTLFARFEPRVVDLRTKQLLSEAEVATVEQQLEISFLDYDQRKAAKDPALSSALTDLEDIASINRREHYSLIYLLRSESGIDRIVLPVHGYGLWSTLYGFLALEADGNTVSGITFYEHAETAGLGGEVDNPAWKAKWPGKQIYADHGGVAMRVIKGAVDPNAAESVHQVDGLSGATLTSNGVSNMIAYWLGDDGYGPVLGSISG
ncbi:MAG: Na(+)-translocating NADH-quinone reductase subunit C [Gammaproteobacteria bacterium TMED95]|jgi:Na+-transporting NADH:ubiquinone oxidoreductase subunit C|nr:Na(+)-translocating NADH-quinone reductase subunit C [Gammaproteobacteria bacterium]OUV22385.1 MAG: Na(+)-translocating NADH-quinone reductase subunit C [Gammaproteobacteria bacterium TMED95]